MESDNAALRTSALISMSTMTVCLTCRSQSKMPMTASVLSACTKILSMSRLNPCCGSGSRSGTSKFPIRTSADGAAVVHTRRQSQTSRQRDHCPVVRAELGARKMQFRPATPRDVGETLAQADVGADTSGNDQAPMPGHLERTAAFLGEGLDHCFLETARDVRSDRVVQNAAPQGY